MLRGSKSTTRATTKVATRAALSIAAAVEFRAAMVQQAWGSSKADAIA